ncbi:DUF3558 domain-containing protein [Saccharopolyspora phatthalungensis]|uniref:DUF3558 domain-containing protein n=1 Tax=Saccharopolyspora phatthalungensis TaxID=664693 RepID=A0A840QEK9_9PSEU|nr:DUF3558 domain-containing protein [Saccharopolyspora phatthalungensis]MBB5155463.1 hypothetical protein [Saccharopolyspora phatthalungensis]
MTVHTTRSTLTAAVSLLVLGLAGCSSTQGGEPEPNTGRQTISAASDPLHIDQPKNLAGLTAPCQLLTPQQLQELGAGASEQDKSEWGQAACRWRNQQLAIKVSPDTVQGQGLDYTAKIYGDGSGNPNAQVSGYPAVHGGVNDLRCNVFVGVSDKQVLSVSFTTGSEGRSNPEYADPCAMADKVAGLVLSNLPPA